MNLFDRFLIWIHQYNPLLQKIGNDQALVVQKVNNTVDSIVCFVTIYPLDINSVRWIIHVIHPLQTADRVQSTRRLRPKGVPFSGLKGYERVGKSVI